MKSRAKKSKKKKETEESNNAAQAASEEKATTIDDEYVPADGSWIAELDEAKEELKDILKLPGGVSKHRGDALQAYLRLCRTYSTLRLWDDLESSAKKGLDVCATYTANKASSGTSASRVAEWKARFKSYREHARKEKAVPTTLTEPIFKEVYKMVMQEGMDPNMVPWRHPTFPNTNYFHNSAISGDVRTMEALVAMGSALDFPMLDHYEDFQPEIVAPTDATALVMVCATLATVDRDEPLFPGDPVRPFPKSLEEDLARITECAMQLVRLGANLHATLNMSMAPETKFTRAYRAVRYDGLSALELARLTRRPELVELMERHARYTPEERAQVAHCRCGSRLPWEQCHSTGIGLPLHYSIHETYGLIFRVSPLARCPCRNTAKLHVNCCWKDTSKPSFLIDAKGNHVRSYIAYRGSEQFDAGMTMRELSQALPAGEMGPHNKDLAVQFAAHLRSNPDALHKVFAHEGPKSRVASWDPMVYAGCLDRVEDKDNFFLWKDLHWSLDKTEVVRRATEWNRALQKYCDDQGMVGDERKRVVERHTANPCAPCGRVGCDAFETEVRQYPRCSRCKKVSYCSRDCQRLDWTGHRRGCVSQDDALAHRSSIMGRSPHIAVVQTSKPLK
jgi:MYND finger